MTTNNVWKAMLPPTVIIVQATEAMWDTPASEREREFVRRAIPRRQREYQAGRAAARTALRVLGVEGFDLLPFPATGRFLDFLDVRIRLDARSGFDAELCADGPQAFGHDPVSGRYARRDGLIFTAVSVSRIGSARL
jgi:4'-phosphopantetheinyl transferase EntD